MHIKHHLASGHNVIPLKNPTYKTEHTQRGDVIEHIGWKIVADTASENPRQAKHRYEFVFTPEELREFLAWGTEQLARFEGTAYVQSIIDGTDPTQALGADALEDDDTTPSQEDA
jgi:hypothetical protein